MTDSEFRNPLISVDDRLEIAIGAVRFNERVITNLRQQINHLRLGMKSAGVPESLIDELQFCHIPGRAQ